MQISLKNSAIGLALASKKIQVIAQKFLIF